MAWLLILLIPLSAFYSAMFSEKETGKAKPIKADFSGVRLPDRYVFGTGEAAALETAWAERVG